MAAAALSENETETTSTKDSKNIPLFILGG